MPVYKDKNRNSWFFKVCIKGRQFLRRGFESKKEAINAEASFLIENNKKPKNSKKELSYVELLNEYKKYLKKEFKITYYLSVAREIDHYYSTLFKDVSINKLTYNDVSKARKIIDEANVNVATKNKRRSFLIRFFHWIKIYYDYDFYLIERMQVFKDYSIKKTVAKSDMVQHEDFIKIYKSCDNPFYKLAFLTFYLFGLRLGELLALKVDAFDLKNKSFQVYQEVSFKTGLGHYVIVPP